MAAFTCAMAEEAFQHIITVVMAIPADHPLVLSLNQEGIKDIMDLLSLSPRIIDTLTYVDDQKATVDIPKYAKSILHTFNIFVIYKASIDEAITNANWKLIIKKKFDDFHSSPAYIAACSVQLYLFLQLQPLGTSNLRQRTLYWNLSMALRGTLIYLQPSRKISNGMHGREQQ